MSLYSNFVSGIMMTKLLRQGRAFGTVHAFPWGRGNVSSLLWTEMHHIGYSIKNVLGWQACWRFLRSFLGLRGVLLGYLLIFQAGSHSLTIYVYQLIHGRFICVLFLKPHKLLDLGIKIFVSIMCSRLLLVLGCWNEIYPTYIPQSTVYFCWQPDCPW